MSYNNWEPASDEQRKALIYESNNTYDFMVKLIPAWRFMGLAVCVGLIIYGASSGISFIRNTSDNTNLFFIVLQSVIPILSGLFALFFMSFKLPKVISDMQSEFVNAIESNNVLITTAYLNSKYMESLHTDHDRKAYYIKTTVDGVERTIRVSSEFYNTTNIGDMFYVIDTGMDGNDRFICRDRHFCDRMISEMNSNG